MLSPSVTKRLIEEFASQAQPEAVPVALPDDLTEREREALELLAHGLSNREIAAEMFIGEATAKTHVSRAGSSGCDRVGVVLAYEQVLCDRAPRGPRTVTASPQRFADPGRVLCRQTLRAVSSIVKGCRRSAMSGDRRQRRDNPSTTAVSASLHGHELELVRRTTDNRRCDRRAS